jgi:predicted O-methyltransferase YrrM
MVVAYEVMGHAVPSRRQPGAIVDLINFLRTLPIGEPYADYVNAPDYYPFLNALAKDFGACRVLEVGVRFGYSAIAFAHGNAVTRYVGIDNDSYEPNGLAKCRANLDHLNSVQAHIDFDLIEMDSQKINDLNFLGGEEFDLVHIDGDHSYGGALSDMKQFWRAVAVGGHMLVDDSLYIPDVQRACVDFTSIVREPHYNVRTLRGTWVYLKTRDMPLDIAR